MHFDMELSSLKGPKSFAPKTFPQRRQTWSNRFDFFISLLGSAVGLGNVWRFPFLCYRNGGGVFLIPYLICIFLAALPLLVLEISLGQLMSRGGVGIWDLCPLFRGIGLYNLSYLIIGSVGYAIVNAWALYYTFLSFISPLPWGTCSNSWNSENCTNNLTNGSTGVSSTAEFWEYRVLGLSEGIGDPGAFQWQLFLCVVALWLIIFLCLFRGVSITGKVMYVVVILPYILLFLLLGYTATMPGSSLGVFFFLKPDWTRLGDLQVWADAGVQIYFSLVGGGNSSVALGSYNEYNKRSIVDCVWIAILNSVTSFVAGFVIFMALGAMSAATGVPVSEVAESGPGLAFVTYPIVLQRLPIASLWSVIFFLMMVGLGLSSMLMGAEAITCAFSDIIPSIAEKRSKHRIFFVFALSTASVVLSVAFTHGNGMFLLNLSEFFNGSRFIFFTSLLQLIVLMYVCDRRRIISAICRMYRLRLAPLLFIAWGFVCPPVMAFLAYCSIRAYTTLSFRRGTTGEIYLYPQMAVGLGWVLAVAEFAFIPVFAGYCFIRSPGDGVREKLRNSIRPRLDPLRRRRFESVDSLW